TWDEAFLMVQVLQSGTNDILAQLNAPPLPAYVPLARGNLQPRATATPSANSISLKSTDMIPSTTSNPQILPRLASLSKTSKGKQKSKDMTRPMTESREGLSRTVTEEDGEGREADVEDSKSFKVTDPFNIVRPRCPNCSAVRCSRDHSEEWCDCECWMCARAPRAAMAAPQNGPATEAASSSREKANTSTGAPDEPKVAAGDSSLNNSPKTTAKDTMLPRSMTKVLGRPNFKTKGPKLASKKTGDTASKKALALSLVMDHAEEETNDDAVGEPLNSPDMEASEDGEIPKRKRGGGTTQPAKKKGTMSATEEEKLWKPTDPFNVQRPRCTGCQAVFCTCGYKPEYCSCTCWSCGQKAGGK
ncbi:hypothetical protein HII31_06484, partial [Pseudocercospora fuligena]